MLISDMKFTINFGKIPEAAWITGLWPARIKKSDKDEAVKNAITWLFVMEDEKHPMEIRVPAMRKLPRYPEIIAPVSGLPR
jgi:hypothetical protein